MIRELTETVVLLFIFCLSALAGTLCAYAAEGDPCTGKQTSILIEKDRHILMLCQENRESGSFKVSFGRGGMNKRRKGDNRTPVGEYSLGTPRPSNRFGIFIPIGYPAPWQRSAGYTGGDIGIHGPDRRFAWLGRFTTWYDWTQGCIAVGSDEEISRIAEWVKEQRAGRVFIE